MQNLNAVSMMLAAIVAAAILLLLWPRLRSRWELSRAKHPSLAGHGRIARWLARRIPHYEYDDAQFFRADDAPAEVVARRRQAYARLVAANRERHPESLQLTAATEAQISDLQFTNAYRVPFQFSRRVRDELGAGNFVTASSGVTVSDPDGNRYYDLTGSYGTNVFGYDFYKECIDCGAERVRDLGPVLGAYHPIVADNVRRLLAIARQDELSFHMSGTEAVMQAVQLARYHTGRTHLVRFCGAYHGWWGEVQPGIGNPVSASRTYTLRDMDEASLRVLRRRRDIACVLVNPLQALHPNRPAPSDSALVDSSRRAQVERERYAQWLLRLRELCSERGIVLIFDEVFVGFRLALGGAQEYFGVSADLVTYGKTVGGGLPVGVICGRSALMRRFRDRRPADVCFARGTFNSHPYVMGAMNEFLCRLESPALRAMYEGLDECWNERAARLNARLHNERLPLQVANLSSIWTTFYTQPSRYNWMLQYYLRAAGLALSWVGTGRLIFSLNYSEVDFEAVAERFVGAAQAMRRDGWWEEGCSISDRAIRRRILRETISHALPGAAKQGVTG